MKCDNTMDSLDEPDTLALNVSQTLDAVTKF